MKTEAQKAANRRYNQKIKDQITTWGSRFWRTDMERFNDVLKAHNMSRADFIRWAVDKLESEGK
jgi:hypothetical protein